MRRGLERRELFLELGDARGQSVPLGLERLAVARAHHHNLRLAPRFLYTSSLRNPRRRSTTPPLESKNLLAPRLQSQSSRTNLQSPISLPPGPPISNVQCPSWAINPYSTSTCLHLQHTRIYSKTRSDESHHVHHAARPANCTAEIVSNTGAKSLFVASSAAPVRYCPDAPATTAAIVVTP